MERGVPERAGSIGGLEVVPAVSPRSRLHRYSPFTPKSRPYPRPQVLGNKAIGGRAQSNPLVVPPPLLAFGPFRAPPSGVELMAGPEELLMRGHEGQHLRAQPLVPT